MLRLPGLIDPHVHMREPGGEYKEDWDSGTASVIAGGFTVVLAMPNTQPPVTDRKTLDLALAAAKRKARCDYAQYLGAGVDNVGAASALASGVAGLKMYLDQTYGPLRLSSTAGGAAPSSQDALWLLRAHSENWPTGSPIVAHAEGLSLAAVILMAALTNRPVHLAHVSRADEIQLIRKAKAQGIKVTCEVTPHHLFLTEDDIERLGAGRSEVRPRLATAADRDALWANLEIIDCFATDHAPHTAEEKDVSNPPPGFPGLETALPLLLTAVHDGRLTVDDLVLRMWENPRRIFGIPIQDDTWVEVDESAIYEIRSRDAQTRCGWTPFEGFRGRGRVTRVVLRGQTVYRHGRVLAACGSGRNIRLRESNPNG